MMTSIRALAAQTFALAIALGILLGSVIGPALAQSTSVGGAVPFHMVAANSTNATLVSPGAHTVYSAELGGIGSVPAYVKFYDKSSAPTCGTDTPIKTLIIPAAATAANGASSNVNMPGGMQINNGLGICVTGGIADSDTTAVAASSFTVNIDYK